MERGKGAEAWGYREHWEETSGEKETSAWLGSVEAEEVGRGAASGSGNLGKRLGTTVLIYGN